MKTDLKCCPLCSGIAKASTRPRSYGQWLRYDCTNDECGPCEISTKACARLRHSERRTELRKVANSCRNSETQPRIGYDGPSGEFQLELVATGVL